MYKLIKHLYGGTPVVVERLSDNANIPFDPANVDFQQYQKWLSEGNTPIPADTPLPAENT
jgi:hypothetical protein